VKGLADVERHAVEAAEGATGFEKALREAREASAAVVTTAGVAWSALEGQKAKAHEIDVLRQKSESLERHRQALVAAAGLGKEATDQADALRKAKKAFDEADRRHGELVGQKAAQELGQKTERDRAASRAALDLRLAGLRSALKDADRFEQAKDRRAKAQLNRGRQELKLKEKTKAADEAKAKDDQTEAELSAVQALHLAAKLGEGEACPVCGSHEHPALATGTIENRGFDQAFREARDAWEFARGERETASAAFAAATGVADEVERDFTERAEPAQASAALREAVEAVEKDLMDLGEPVDLEAIERTVVKLGEDLSEAEAARETARASHVKAGQDDALARDRYEIALATIPSEYRTAAAIDSAVKVTEAEIVARQNALTAAETAERTAKEKMIGAAKDVESAETALDKAIERRDTARDEFARRLAGEGLTEERYTSCKAWVATIDEDAEAVEGHKRALGIALKNDGDARAAIEGCVRPDLAPLGEALTALQTAAKATTDTRSDINARLGQLRELRDEVAESLSAVQELEARTGRCESSRGCLTPRTGSGLISRRMRSVQCSITCSAPRTGVSGR
jgi:DNA repair protein SbcC/Rad50